MKDFEVEIRLRNNRLKSLRLARGFESASAFANAHALSPSAYCAMEALTFDPIRKDRAKRGHWKDLAVRVATLFNLLPEDLWPEQVLQVAQPKRTFEANAEDLVEAERLFESGRDVPLLPDEAIASVELRAEVDRMLRTLPPRFEQIVRMRVEENLTYDEIAEKYEVTRERARQYFEVALRKLRHRSGLE